MFKPNILLFMVDQMRSDAIAALGNSEIVTPNLDRLVKRGTAFSKAFSPSPVCVPARCSMHYGMYPSSTGCYENNFSMPSAASSFMDVLSEGGYHTHGIGKCHFSPDLLAMRGFKTRLIQEEMMDDWREDDYLTWLFSQSCTKHIVDPYGVRGDMYYNPQVSQMPQELHPTEWVGQKTLEFLKEQESNRVGNWMLFSSFIHPHPPFSPPSPWHKIYRATDVSLPHVNDSCEENYTHINRKQNRYKFKDRGIDFNLIRCMKAYYYACISFIGFQIGKILDYLEKTSQIDDTFIIFTSDHGEYLGDNNCFGKRSMHDQAARVPLLVSYPKSFNRGAICDQPVSLIDIFPTITNCVGLETPGNCQGSDLSKIAAGISQRDMVFSEYAFGDESICMVVSKDWKYFYSVPDQKEFLFDCLNDPYEAINLAKDKACVEVREKYHNKLIEFLYGSGRYDVVDQNGFKAFPVKTISNKSDEGLIYQDQQWANEFIAQMPENDYLSKIQLYTRNKTGLVEQ